MNDPLGDFERLAERARREDAAIAPPDVTAGVLKRLRTVPETQDRPLWWVAAGSFVAALLIVGVSLPDLLEKPEQAAELALYTSWIML